ncbi:MAG: HEAT repeat domain-containing protein [bacterium]
MRRQYESLVERASERVHTNAAPQAFDRRGLAHRETSASVTPSPVLHALPVITQDSVRPRAQIGKALVDLRNGRRSERIRAARELGDIAISAGIKIPEAIVPLSVTLVGDRDPTVRQEAAWSLWKLGDERGHRPLLRALVDDPSAVVREKAARALGLLGVREAIPAMIDLISLERHVPARLRAGIACAFGYLAEERLLTYLLKASEEAEPLVRYEAVRSLGRFLIGFSQETSERVFKLLMRYLKPSCEPCGFIRKAAIKALRFSTAESATVAVAKTLVEDPDAAAREVAADALILWDSEHSERALVAGLTDDFWPVRKAAARSLARFIMRYGVYDSTAVCEALRRMERMFPSHSFEWRLAADAFASL